MWGSIMQADQNEGQGTGTTAAPTAHFVRQLFTADVSTSGITAHVRLVAKGSPVVKSASFVSPTSIGVGQTTGSATPADADLPSLDEQFTAAFRITAQNTGGEGIITWTVALEAMVDGGAWSEVGARTFSHFITSMDVSVDMARSITATVSGVDGSAGGADRFRLRLKDALGPPGTHSYGLTVNANALTWATDASALYASGTPNGDQDAIPFFIIAEG